MVYFSNQVKAEGRILDIIASMTSLARAAYSSGTEASSSVKASSHPLIIPRFASPSTTSPNLDAIAASTSPFVQRSQTKSLTGSASNVPMPTEDLV